MSENKNKLKVVCISDTHYTDERLYSLEIPDGDVLIHAGDATFQGKIGECMRFLNWFNNQTHAQKIFVPGNHDFFFENLCTFPEYESVHILRNEFYSFKIRDERYTVYGMPYVLNLPLWAFHASEEQIAKNLNAVAESLHIFDILVTHSPPFGVMDFYAEQHQNRDGTWLPTGSLGSRALRTFVDRTKPKLHVFGHIHDQYGMQVIGETAFVNAAILDDQYKPTHKPIVVEL